ncbi:MAG TPA: 1,4-beta-xylanase, partial [Anseongella sp.]|nr:1,4-beta-xylanase [Anseongella sp.]
MKYNYAILWLLLIFAAPSAGAQKNKPAAAATSARTSVWSIEKANAWYAENGWRSGANFLPSTAINQLEMWQAQTFDTVTLDRELGWAEDIGFTTMRVFLHSIAWKEDPQGFKNRVGQYLSIASRHGIK